MCPNIWCKHLHLRRLADEQHCVFDCPQSGGLRLASARLYDDIDAHDTMPTLILYKDQEALFALTGMAHSLLMLANRTEAQT